MSFANIRGVYTDARAIAANLGGTTHFGQCMLFLALMSVPIRKRIWGTRPIPLRINFRETNLPIFVRDAADIAIVREIFVEHEYDISFETPPREIVDIGGHAGYASLFFALTFPAAQIRVFEPDSKNYALLTLNTCSIERIHAYHAVVADAPGPHTFFVNDSSISSSLTERSGARAVSVEGVTLDQILAERPADLVKFDVEGAEHSIFAASSHRAECPTYVGEMHYDLFPQTREEFLALFPAHQMQERSIGSQRSIIELRSR
jgi:FkbM family methyltransferase